MQGGKLLPSFAARFHSQGTRMEYTGVATMTAERDPSLWEKALDLARDVGGPPVKAYIFLEALYKKAGGGSNAEFNYLDAKSRYKDEMLGGNYVKRS